MTGRRTTSSAPGFRVARASHRQPRGRPGSSQAHTSSRPHVPQAVPPRTPAPPCAQAPGSAAAPGCDGDVLILERWFSGLHSIRVRPCASPDGRAPAGAWEEDGRASGCSGHVMSLGLRLVTLTLTDGWAASLGLLPSVLLFPPFPLCPLWKDIAVPSARSRGHAAPLVKAGPPGLFTRSVTHFHGDGLVNIHFLLSAMVQ